MLELAESIKESGVLQPGTVRSEKDGNGYEIIVGHRRTCASKMAGMEEMLFFIREMTDHGAIVEHTQRRTGGKKRATVTQTAVHLQKK